MFEKGTRIKARFNFKGTCSIEDLWDLSVRALDLIHKNLNIEIRGLKEVSLLEVKNKEEELLELKIAIVKHIVEVKLQEQKSREDAASRAEKKQRILGIMEEKQNSQLKELSLEELAEMAKTL